MYCGFMVEGVKWALGLGRSDELDLFKIVNVFKNSGVSTMTFGHLHKQTSGTVSE